MSTNKMGRQKFVLFWYCKLVCTSEDTQLKTYNDLEMSNWMRIKMQSLGYLWSFQRSRGGLDKILIRLHIRRGATLRVATNTTMYIYNESMMCEKITTHGDDKRNPHTIWCENSPSTYITRASLLVIYISKSAVINTTFDPAIPK